MSCSIIIEAAYLSAETSPMLSLCKCQNKLFGPWNKALLEQDDRV